MAEEGQRDVFKIYVKFCLRIVQIFNKSVKLCCRLVWH